MLKTIIFEIEAITPMFLAGADQTKAELRAASIKGLLRFWWRALQSESDLNKLRAKESAIFGSSEEKTGGGSSFSIRITTEGNLQSVTKNFPFKENVHKIMVTSRSKNKTFHINILEYLAYGPFDPKAKKLRPYFDAKTKFNLTFSCRDDRYVDDILNTLYVFSLFGGIGSRSRNGFGGFSITKAEGDMTASHNIVSPTTRYSSDFLKKMVLINSTIQQFPSFSHGTKIFCTKQPKSTWDEVLADVGKIYRDIRIGDKKLNNSVFEIKHNYQKRQYLGAPLDPFGESFHSFLDRHAKPYFIKIAKEGNQFRGYILYLPSLYCNGLERDRNERQINHVEVNKKFAEICSEFNGFLAQHMEAVNMNGGNYEQ